LVIAVLQGRAYAEKKLFKVVLALAQGRRSQVRAIQVQQIEHDEQQPACIADVRRRLDRAE